MDSVPLRSSLRDEAVSLITPAANHVMPFEVEQKHRVVNMIALRSRLTERGVVIGPPVRQSDCYFAHPSRDFGNTDEALRIRTAGGESFVTYKGPKVDKTTKTRREIELPLDPHDTDGARFGELLDALGFRPVATVTKERRMFEVKRGPFAVEGALDDVEGVGQFIELELTADDAGLDAACRQIDELARELELGPSERRSYLELLLER
jgi:adenylate cyclase class 2